MKAMVRHSYGSPDVLRLEEVERPAPGDGEVLVRVRAASVNAIDWRLLRADPPFIRLFGGLLRPRHEILGADIAGRVEAVGDGVARLRPGQDVFGDLARHGFGAFAEYAVAPEEALAHRPEGTTWEEAAAAPLAGVTALQGLRDRGGIRSGMEVLVNGASGGVGTFAVQIARAFGAEVTGVCSAAKADLVRSIGAEHVIDYTREDYARSGRHWDLILDCAAHRPPSEVRRVLSPEGTYVLVGGSTLRMAQTAVLGPWSALTGGPEMKLMVTRTAREDLDLLGDLIASGKVAPVIDRRYELGEVPAALRHVEEGRVRGKVVVTA